MARAALTRTVLPATGLNLTDATFATLGTGAGNGVEFNYRKGDLLVLKNDTGGAAVFTLVVPDPASLSAIGASVGDMSVSVATGKTWVVPVAAVLRQNDGDVYVDCDVAGKAMVLAAQDT